MSRPTGPSDDDESDRLRHQLLVDMYDISARIRALQAVRGVSSEVPVNAVDAVLRDWLVAHRRTLKRLARAFLAIESGEQATPSEAKTPPTPVTVALAPAPRTIIRTKDPP